jgi:50S ribosomal protein L16 3-hydroxylase
MHLADFDAEAFLRDTWQRRPLLIRNPWAEWTNPLEPDELAGLACEPDVESRLVVQAGGQWSVEHGPIPPARFGQLGRGPWTLLVQAADHHVPQVAALIEPFRFLPNWRIDDVMVSYATDGGGVGPHFDQYDVFLIQGLGRRRWRVGQLCGDGEALLPHDDLRLLERFEATDEWVLEPGDILYIPPRFAHDGVALGDDCMTYSIGFRAPSRRDLIAGWCDAVLGDLADGDRYADPGLSPQANPGEITAEALARLQGLIAERLMDRETFADWFGRHASTPRYPEIDFAPDRPVTTSAIRKAIRAGAALQRNPASRFSFIVQPADGIALFVDGRRLACDQAAEALVREICARDVVEIGADLSEPELALIKALCDQGSLALTDDD